MDFIMGMKMAKNDWLYIVAGFGAVLILYLYLNKSSSTTTTSTSTQSTGVINTPDGSLLIKTNDGFNLGDWLKRFPTDINTYTFGEKFPPSTPSGIISGIATPIDISRSTPTPPPSPDQLFPSQKPSGDHGVGGLIRPLSSTAPALGFASPSPSGLDTSQSWIIIPSTQPSTQPSPKSTQIYVAPHSTQLYVAPSTSPSTPSTQLYTPSTSVTHTSTGFKVSII